MAHGERLDAGTRMIRPLAPGDHAAVVGLNNATVPAVTALDEAALRQLVDWSVVAAVAVADGVVVGFVLCLPGPGLAYASPNYRWFGDRFDSFLYVDRVVVAPHAKGRGTGRTLYQHAIEAARRRYPRMTAEVNVRPRNDESLAFHRRLGFGALGEADTDGGAKRVVYLCLPLSDETDVAPEVSSG